MLTRLVFSRHSFRFGPQRPNKPLLLDPILLRTASQLCANLISALLTVLPPNRYFAYITAVALHSPSHSSVYLRTRLFEITKNIFLPLPFPAMVYIATDARLYNHLSMCSLLWSCYSGRR